MSKSETVLVRGRNKETAGALLEAAQRLGLPASVVQTSSRGGYLVPKEVHDELGNAPGEGEPVDTDVNTPATQLRGLEADDPGQKRLDEAEGSQVDGKVEDNPTTLGPGLVTRETGETEAQDEPPKRGRRRTATKEEKD